MNLGKTHLRHCVLREFKKGSIVFRSGDEYLQRLWEQSLKCQEMPGMVYSVSVGNS